MRLVSSVFNEMDSRLFRAVKELALRTMTTAINLREDVIYLLKATSGIDHGPGPGKSAASTCPPDIGLNTSPRMA